ncbi:MAG: MMPL family transporter, partial [Mycobacterium sp.]
FIIGVGILLDTFIVRTLMVPTLAQAFGKLSWWPSKA